MNDNTDTIRPEPAETSPAVDSASISQPAPLKNVTRRDFIKIAAAASAGAILAACAPSAPAPVAPSSGGAPAGAPTLLKGTTLHMLQWSHFVPEGDQFFDKWAADWGQKNNVQVTVEHINSNDIPARIAGHVQAKAGPDIIQNVFGWPALYSDALVDVSDIADKLGSQLGGWYKDMEAYSKINGVWRAIPFSFYAQVLCYRQDWFKQAGINPPTTLDEFISMAQALNEAGHPLGLALGHSFSDPRVSWYPWLWWFGGKEVEQDGKTIALDSPDTLEAVTRAVELYKLEVPGTLSWDDTSNNRAFYAGQIGATTNAASIYFTLVKNDSQIQDQRKTNAQLATAADMMHAVLPAGRQGKASLQSTLTNGIMNWSKNVSGAKDFITAMMQPDVYNQYLSTVRGYNFGPLHAYDDAPVWKTDPKIAPFRDQIMDGSNRWPGWPAPPSPAGERVLEDFTIIDMFAKACSGEFTPKESIAAAVTRLKNFYK